MQTFAFWQPPGNPDFIHVGPREYLGPSKTGVERGMDLLYPTNVYAVGRNDDFSSVVKNVAYLDKKFPRLLTATANLYDSGMFDPTARNYSIIENTVGMYCNTDKAIYRGTFNVIQVKQLYGTYGDGWDTLPPSTSSSGKLVRWLQNDFRKQQIPNPEFPTLPPQHSWKPDATTYVQWWHPRPSGTPVETQSAFSKTLDEPTTLEEVD